MYLDKMTKKKLMKKRLTEETNPLLSNVWKASYTISASIFVDFSHWSSYNTYKFISYALPGPSQWVFHFGEEIIIAWTQEQTTTLGSRPTEPHHSSWQCKESHRSCHTPLAPLQMGDSGTSTVLTRYESMRLRSLRQSERTAARNPVQHKIWTYLCCR